MTPSPNPEEVSEKMVQHDAKASAESGVSTTTKNAKAKSAASLREALEFLTAHADRMRTVAPKGQEDEYARALWRPSPLIMSYSWPAHYGDFSPATLMAGVRSGFIERPDPDRHAYRITEAGMDFLSVGAPNHGLNTK